MSSVPGQRAPNADDAEWRLRCDLAAVFRAAARFDWCGGPSFGQDTDRISALLPGGARFLINPRGLLFREMTASALAAHDFDDGAFPIHARLHRARDGAACVLRVQPRYLTALAMTQGGRMALAHHNNLRLNDRVVYDEGSDGASEDLAAEGERLARALGEKSILLTASRGVTIVGASVHEAFGECATAEHTTRFQLTALTQRQGLHLLPERERLGWTGPWGKYSDARMLLDAWRRVLDQEEPDYAT
jgi:ribulose-5-phosphate 4-epimerase/fuculose-1-phosphate aldolase